MTMLCDRCGAFYTPSPQWPRNPLCPACLIGTRRAETADTWPRPTTTRELDNTIRHHCPICAHTVTRTRGGNIAGHTTDNGSICPASFRPYTLTVETTAP